MSGATLENQRGTGSQIRVFWRHLQLEALMAAFGDSHGPGQFLGVCGLSGSRKSTITSFCQCESVVVARSDAPQSAETPGVGREGGV